MPKMFSEKKTSTFVFVHLYKKENVLMRGDRGIWPPLHLLCKNHMIVICKLVITSKHEHLLFMCKFTMFYGNTGNGCTKLYSVAGGDLFTSTD